MKPVDPVQDSDLDAYVDDQLDLGRRIEVEAYLSAHPEIAARVMADLSVKGELRLALAEPVRFFRQETREQARKLERGLSRGMFFQRFRRLAAACLLLTAGWLANAHVGPFASSEVSASVHAPVFVEEAIRAHDTALLRKGMPSQPAVPAFNPDEIRSVTGIVMPVLPVQWSVSDVQIFPSASGPSVEIAALGEHGKKVSLFAVRPGDFSVQRVTDLRSDGTRASYWQTGDVAYALVSSEMDERDLSRTAETLSSTLY